MPDFKDSNTAAFAAHASPATPGSTLRVRIAQHDWAASALGPMDDWPMSLRTVVALMLDSTEPMVAWWGDELVQIFNDAYAPRVAHCGAAGGLGERASDCWKHSWHTIEPQVSAVMSGHSANRYQDILISIERSGALVDTYWTYSFTPLRNDAGAVGGVLLISTETTERVLSVRRQQTLDLLRHHLSGARTAGEIDAALALVVSHIPRDLHAVTELSLAAAGPSRARSPRAGGERQRSGHRCRPCPGVCARARGAV